MSPSNDPLTDRIVDEIDALRDDVRNLCDGFIRVEERLGGFIAASEERSRKISERVTSVEARTTTGERRWWLLAGAYAAIPVVWVVLHILGR